MLVKELIEELQKMPQDVPVCFSHDAGNYTHTIVANEVDAVEKARVAYSGYHEMWKLVDDDEESEQDVVVLAGIG